MNCNDRKNITVLIVDDESLIRQRIALHVNRAGYTIIGFAKDGQEASELIAQHNPDIVITDIAMPKVTGVQLLEQARRDGNTSHFIFITGFDDFSYALSALKNKASDYLLKPVDPKLLLQAVEKAYEDICEQQKQQDAIRAYGNLKDASLLYQILSGTGDLVEGCSDSLATVLRHLDGVRLLLIHNGGSPFDGDLKPYLLPNGVHLYFILPGDMGILNQLSSDDTYLAVGNPLSDMESLKVCFPMLRRTLLRRLISPKTHLFYQTDKQDNSSSLSDFTQHNKALLEQNQLAKLRELIPNEVNTLTSAIALERYTASLFDLFREFKLNGQGFPWQAYSPLWILERFDGRAELIEYLQRALDSIVSENNDSSLSLVDRVKAFLDFNYMHSGLSLEAIGLRVYAHPNYVSTKFKEETDKTVIAYLTELRLEKAKALLESTEFSCGQIAVSVGFQDQGYFSKCFKKQYGYPPTACQNKKS